MNKAMLIGNLGKDPELRYTQNQTAVASFSVATAERQKKGETWENVTEWHNVVTWGKTAENCAKYLAKGKKVFVEGKIQTRSWEDKDGNKRYTTEIVAQNVQFLDSKSDDKGQSMPADDSDAIPF